MNFKMILTNLKAASVQISAINTTGQSLLLMF